MNICNAKGIADTLPALREFFFFLLEKALNVLRCIEYILRAVTRKLR